MKRRSFGLASFGGSLEGCKQYQLSLPSLGQTSASRELHLLTRKWTENYGWLKSKYDRARHCNKPQQRPSLVARNYSLFLHVHEESIVAASCSLRIVVYHWLCLPTDC